MIAEQVAKDISNDVYDAAVRLNKALATAHQNGLKVQVIVPIQLRTDEPPRVQADVYRRV